MTRTDVLSTSEVAELLGIPRSTVHELARRGDLPARRVERRWLFLRDRARRGDHAARRSGCLEASKRRLKSPERYSTALLRHGHDDAANAAETR
ncbi:MAG: helix-turn-helix domain-containing protein [Thermoleophilaceae bacterium]|nr:helix-turn-helix domain-containing protein [Thermoleophilaceae bacterium]